MYIQDNQNTVIELLAQNEETIGRLYFTYAEKFPDLKALWLGLANDENTHASWIRELKEKIGSGKMYYNRGRFTSTTIHTFINLTEEKIAAVKGTDLRIINALSIALYIEKSLIESKFFEVFETDSVELKHLLQSLEVATKKHSQTLHTMLEKYK